ncbi:MAG: AraC family transcriptional regulator [Cyanothece sp. SIO1E1]|nr:AraC family transcriptional regulator [Cyanothece sp. SIO1E1]
MKRNNDIIRLDTISQVHSLLGLARPKHPLITVYRHTPQIVANTINLSFSGNLYYIAMKDSIKGSLQYGRNSYDFEEGMMMFLAPNQVYTTPEEVETDNESLGWSILFHPDLIRKSHLGQIIDRFSFFDYDVNEALHLSDREKQTINELVEKIENEIVQNIDRHSQELINVNLESLLKYCKRYYERQFYTRTNWNQDYIIRFEKYIKNYFSSNELSEKGVPTIQQCGEALNMSGHYLSDLLKAETGKSAKEHIHLHLVNKAKSALLNTNQSVSEIAFIMGFEYPQNFSKMFKSKTGLSPTEYRKLN